MLPFALAPFLCLVVGDRSDVAERRALAYLAREVPRWSVANRCYSCHNNGDAARALYMAVARSRLVPAGALADTSRWLSRPGLWDNNGGARYASDKGLDRIQFAAALDAAFNAGLVKDRAALARAAELVAEGQRPDGSWAVDADGTVGSPTSYGTALATHLARRTLLRADPARYRAAVARADRWLRRTRVHDVTDAAAVLLALGTADDADARAQRRRSLDLLRRGQGDDGGWGPSANAASEPFDTALVLLALAPDRGRPELAPLVRRGREYLAAAQQPDGSWRETTRPPGAESYAQRLSTTGWATLALLETGP